MERIDLRMTSGWLLRSGYKDDVSQPMIESDDGAALLQYAALALLSSYAHWIFQGSCTTSKSFFG